jgi:hypothetical protein
MHEKIFIMLQFQRILLIRNLFPFYDFQFLSMHTGLFTVEFPRKFNVMQHKIPKAQIARYHV